MEKIMNCKFMALMTLGSECEVSDINGAYDEFKRLLVEAVDNHRSYPMIYRLLSELKYIVKNALSGKKKYSNLGARQSCVQLP